MADSYRIITDGAGQQIVNQLAELLAVITTGSASSVNASSYTSKAPLTEDSGRSVASKLASLTTAFASYYEDKQKLDGIEDNANNYSLPTATASVLGGIKAAAVRTTAPTKTTGGTTSSRYYGVELDSAGVAFVNVPWSNTTYSAATTSAAGLMSASDKTKLDGIEESANNYTHPTVTAKDTTSSASPSAGETVTMIDSVSRDSSGHVTGVNTKTVTLPKAACLEDMSWDEISAISLAGKAPSIFHVGQEKKIELSDGETVTAVILGFNHDDLADGTGKAGITFGLKNALKTTYTMNSSSTNAGGWTSSVMRATNMQTFKGWLPSDLQAVLQTVTKKTSAGSASSTIESTEDELFLFSQVEVFGTYYYNQGDSPTQRSYAGEGHQYDYYKGKTSCSYYAKYAIDPFGTSRTYTALVYYQENAYKGLSDSATASYTWWLRSPYYGNSTYFCGVNGTGICHYYNANVSYGVVFGFCV